MAGLEGGSSYGCGEGWGFGLGSGSGSGDGSGSGRGSGSDSGSGRGYGHGSGNGFGTEASRKLIELYIIKHIPLKELPLWINENWEFDESKTAYMNSFSKIG
jgi:hypothetical protein